ncbi:capsid protein, partial [Xanthomonas citri pv. citri]|nr:capsid protein [Xanthomonas citri pv. citri]
PYQLLDAWAKFPDFQTRLSNSIAVQQGLDRIMIGFNGTSAAVTTDLATNPLLQDVNIGWLQKMRASAPDRVIEEGEAGSGKVTIGATGDYKT